MSSQSIYDLVSNSPFLWVDEFLIDNFLFNESFVSYKLQTLRRYNKWAKEKGKGTMTMKEFDKHMMRMHGVKSFTGKDGKEYYEGLRYDPEEVGAPMENCITIKFE